MLTTLASMQELHGAMADGIAICSRRESLSISRFLCVCRAPPGCWEFTQSEPGFVVMKARTLCRWPWDTGPSLCAGDLGKLVRCVRCEVCIVRCAFCSDTHSVPVPVQCHRIPASGLWNHRGKLLSCLSDSGQANRESLVITYDQYVYFSCNQTLYIVCSLADPLWQVEFCAPSYLFSFCSWLSSFSPPGRDRESIWEVR